MNKNICPVCKQEKEDVGPKNMGEDLTLNSPHLVIKTKVMCNNCYKKWKEKLDV